MATCRHRNGMMPLPSAILNGRVELLVGIVICVGCVFANIQNVDDLDFISSVFSNIDNDGHALMTSSVTVSALVRSCTVDVLYPFDRHICVERHIFA